MDPAGVRRQQTRKEATIATNIRIIHAHEFIRATPEGLLDLKKAQELLMEIASAATPLADYQIILDVRKTQQGMRTSDLWYLAAELTVLRKAFSRKTAVLCPLEGFNNAEFFALCAQNRGFQIKAFTSFEDAIEWLITNGT
jgi:hypothetical protein